MALPEWLNTRNDEARNDEEWYRLNWDIVVSVHFTPERLTLRRLSGSTVADGKSAVASTPAGMEQSRRFEDGLRAADWLELRSDSGITFVDWTRIDGVSVKPDDSANVGDARRVYRLFSAGAVVAQTTSDRDGDEIHRRMKERSGLSHASRAQDGG